MKIPYRPTNFEKMRSRPKYIILHDINCAFENMRINLIDDNKSQVNKIRSDNYIINNQSDLNYHFAIEQINDYETIIGRPITMHCEYDDIPIQYKNSIHIGMMGSFEYDIPDQRYYRHLAYRSIVPMMSIYGIPIGNIILHKDITSNKLKNCPGVFFDKNKLLQSVRAMMAIKM